ncbi:hypothetical protein [Sphingomonas sp. CFBP 13733]|uniref:hypothetical protein n=1 Tax=Sphingomonas sp. CFBP 13733 TaxID=2775291 RepID=UPI001782D152|nr:hypothetical protein [Sphingomonas sp. CFBP 13733]MBD8640287.1 hypothetical protein [Sphingomonas sp. CFBP 13733]
MNDIDMTGVDPLRRSEVRRRIGVVRAYLEIADPVDDDRREHAERLGLSANQFMALVRAWREHGSAAKVAGSGAARGVARRRSGLAVPKAAKAIAGTVIDERGPAAAFVDINRAVVTRCAASGVAAPSRSTVWNMVMARRQLQNGAGTGIVMGTCRVRLPVETEGVLAMPSLLVAVRADDGTILAAAMDQRQYEVPHLLAALGGAPEGLRISRDLVPAEQEEGDGISLLPPTAVRSALARVLGRGIDSVRLVYVASKAVAPARLLTAREDRPLLPDEIRSVVSAAIVRHNAARGGYEATWLDGSA